ncbi:MAG: hypothetical protein GF313_04235 [Caldithrix sp.]|nr:hypothetical protein [Caldithrix sp.]
MMELNHLLQGNLNVSTLEDEKGRQYFSIKIVFSEDDVVTVYRNSMDELIKELPSIIASAIQARIFNDQFVIN